MAHMVLMIQFRDDFTLEHERECVGRVVPEGQQVRFVSIFDESQPWDKPEELIGEADRILFGAAAAISLGPNHKEQDYAKVELLLKRVRPLVDYVFAKDFPTLAFCLGHHLFAQLRGEAVANDLKRAETGAFEITLSDEGEADRLFEGVPRQFYAIEGHQDSVNPPEGVVVLASSEKYPYQAFRFRNNIYTTQFHGELNVDDLIYRVERYPQYKAAGFNFDRVPTPHAVKVLKNFLSFSPERLRERARALDTAR
jgi:GMP synthase-like glutamine amidotransferase